MKKITAILLVLVLLLTTSATTLAAGGNTLVSVTVDSTQISVTVPTTLAIGAKVDGGPATVPENHKIVNSSAIPVKVDTIAVAFNAEATDWAFSDGPIAVGTEQVDGKNAIYLSVNGQVLQAQGATAPTTRSNWNISASSDLELPLDCSTSQLNTTGLVENLITITYVISAGTHA